MKKTMVEGAEAFASCGVLCVGAIMVDVICRVPRLPGRGEGRRVRRSASCGWGVARSIPGNVVRQLGAPCFSWRLWGAGCMPIS